MDKALVKEKETMYTAVLNEYMETLKTGDRTNRPEIAARLKAAKVELQAVRK